MRGQPEGFAVVNIIPTDKSSGAKPANIVDVGASLTLKTYMHVNKDVQQGDRKNTRLALVGGVIAAVNVPATGSVEYHLQDLETGAMVPAIAGGTIIELTATSTPTRAAVLGPGGDLEGFPDTLLDDYYLSPDTAAITTGAAGTLKLPAATSQSGTWRGLVHVHGGPGSFVSAFDDGLLIQIIA
jgi:hypothetical protein